MVGWLVKSDQSSKKGPFPSRRVVGPMLIGVLITALVKGLDTFNLVGEGGEKVVFDDELLKTGREAYTQLRVKKGE
jgi:hypothetical protein